MTNRCRAALTLACIALAACSPGQAGGRAAHSSHPSSAASAGGPAGSTGAVVEVRHPVSGLRLIPLLAGGHGFVVELAESEEAQQRGLMFRTAMGADEGMLFPRRQPADLAFWMRNTVIPLDIIFIGKDRRILNIARGVPYDETPLPSAGPAIAVLELNGGRAAALGLKPGDRVSW